MNSAKAPLPPKLRRTLRIAFAGNTHLPGDTSIPLRREIETILKKTAAAMTAPLAQTSQSAQGPSEAHIHTDDTPLVRLVTGLAEGADAMAAEALLSLCETSDLGVEVELAAVIPFDYASYRASRPAAFRHSFDQHAAACTYILQLDGIFDKPEPDTELAQLRRRRGYRAQSAMLLRHGDILLAAANPAESGKAGGTLETIREAMRLQMPVVFLDTLTMRVRVLTPEDDLDAIVTSSTDASTDWSVDLENLVRTLMAPSAADALDAGEARRHRHSTDGFPEIFFERASIPPGVLVNGTYRRRESLREKRWNSVIDLLRPAGVRPKSDSPIAAYSGWRKRATELNYHYSGLYRGTFFLNFAVAVAAVALASSGLALHAMGWVHTPWAFLPFAICELACVGLMFLWTQRANDEAWHHLTVDTRYLAERLRTLYYLPLVGSFRPPVASPLRYSIRTLRQSGVDLIFDLITRSVSPAAVLAAVPTPATNDGTPVNTRGIEVLHAVQRIRTDWIEQQATYHTQNAATMRALKNKIEKWGRRLSRAVVGVVVVDLLALVAAGLDLLPGWADHSIPLLSFLAASIPAGIASLSGLRFQSECERLADRSATLATILVGTSTQYGPIGGRAAEADALIARIHAAAAQPPTDPGAWSHEVLRLAERVAKDLVEETAEWSVIYAKEIPET